MALNGPRFDMTDPIAPPPGFTAALVFDDPTPNAVILNRINRRAVEIAGSCTDLNREECNDFLDLVMLISRNGFRLETLAGIPRRREATAWEIR